MADRSFVIAVSGTSGAGKSTTCRHLNSRIPDSTHFQFDAYEEVPGIFPHVRDWHAQNFDPHMLNLSHPLADFTRLLRGESIQYPLNGGVVNPAAVVIFDTPLGRAHPDFGGLIDLSVCIDLPHEVALARRIQRIIDQSDSDHAVVNRLRTFLPFYLQFGRLMYRHYQDAVKASADLIVDGLQSTDAITDAILQVMRAHPIGKIYV